MPASADLPRNPYWEGIQALCDRGHAEIQHNTLIIKAGYGSEVGELRARYGHVISDPGLVQWVADAVGRSVVEIDARDGYWSWLLRQARKFTVSYDPKPPHEAWVPILKSGRDRAELRYRDFESSTLLSVMPSSFTKLQVALRAFAGAAFVVITDDVKIRAHPETLGAPEWSWWASHRGVSLGQHLIVAHLYKRAVKPTDPPWQAPTQRLRTIPPRAV